MSSSWTDLFMATVTLDTSIDPTFSNEYYQINAILKESPDSCFCAHKYKVTGEPMLVLVFRVKEVKQLEKTLDSIRHVAKCTIECIALNNYEPLAETLGVDESLTKKDTDNCIAGCPRLIWILFTVNYDGKSMAELISDWKKEATFALGARARGIKLELFKVVAEFKVHVFIERSFQDIDAMMSQAPMLQENVSGLNGKCKTVLDLDYFCE